MSPADSTHPAVRAVSGAVRPASLVRRSSSQVKYLGTFSGSRVKCSSSFLIGAKRSTIFSKLSTAVS